LKSFLKKIFYLLHYALSIKLIITVIIILYVVSFLTYGHFYPPKEDKLYEKQLSEFIWISALPNYDTIRINAIYFLKGRGKLIKFDTTGRINALRETTLIQSHDSSTLGTEIWKINFHTDEKLALEKWRAWWKEIDLNDKNQIEKRKAGVERLKKWLSTYNKAQSDTIISFCKEIPCSLSVPKKFIPNHQEIVSYLHCEKNTFEFKSFSIVICDYWGNEVFSSDSPNKTWSGKIKNSWAPAGFYTWVIKLTLTKACFGKTEFSFKEKTEVYY